MYQENFCSNIQKENVSQKYKKQKKKTNSKKVRISKNTAPDMDGVLSVVSLTNSQLNKEKSFPSSQEDFQQ